ncbi:MAG: YerC/YecD family TrpR-related protein [Patescibacteria group bacterium]|jgi:TrpR-related protein YerC/YecD
MEKFKFNKRTTKLFEAILALKNIEEAEKFFRDLCTAKELQEISERWEIVLLLDKGVTYREIAEKLKTSTTTVSRVANWLNNGMNGYKLVLDRLNHHHNLSPVRKRVR